MNDAWEPMLESLAPAEIAKTAAVVIEPLVQGAAGIRLWPAGTCELFMTCAGAWRRC